MTKKSATGKTTDEAADNTNTNTSDNDDDDDDKSKNKTAGDADAADTVSHKISSPISLLICQARNDDGDTPPKEKSSADEELSLDRRIKGVSLQSISKRPMLCFRARAVTRDKTNGSQREMMVSREGCKA